MARKFYLNLLVDGGKKSRESGGNPRPAPLWFRARRGARAFPTRQEV